MNQILNNIKDDPKNDKQKESNIKYKNFKDVNKFIENLDSKYYNNKFDKKIIQDKYKYFEKLQNIMKDKNNVIDKDILTNKKDELLEIFNDKKFKVIFESRDIKDATPKKLLGSLNSVYNMFGYELNNNRESSSSKDRTFNIKIDIMDCIPKHYIDYEEYLNKHINNDIEYMKYFKTLIDKTEKKIKKIDIDEFIIYF